jgi:hypothetical protein
MSMANARTQLDAFLGTRPAGSAQPREAQDPLRILVLADLGGSARPPLAQRKLLAVDIDNFDALFTRIQPALSLDLDGQVVTCRFTSLDDFHPDHLLARLPIFEALRRARADLQDPSQLARVAASLGLAPVAVSACPPRQRLKTPVPTCSACWAGRSVHQRPHLLEPARRPCCKPGCAKEWRRTCCPT